MAEWKTRTRGQFTWETMCEGIREYINADKYSKYVMYVGTDSQKQVLKDGFKTRFVNAVVITRVGKGGQYYFKKTDEMFMSSLGQKIYVEATVTLALIGELETEFQGLISSGVLTMIPDIDVGDDGETKTLKDGVTGMFKAAGYDNVLTKPYSIASSTVADKHSK